MFHASGADVLIPAAHIELSAFPLRPCSQLSDKRRKITKTISGFPRERGKHGEAQEAIYHTAVSTFRRRVRLDAESSKD